MSIRLEEYPIVEVCIVGKPFAVHIERLCGGVIAEIVLQTSQINAVPIGNAQLSAGKTKRLVIDSGQPLAVADKG